VRHINKAIVSIREYAEICVVIRLKFCNIRFFAYRIYKVIFERIVQMPAKVDAEKCSACETCVDECPSDAISMVGNKAVVDIEACVDCGVCIDACPEEAISME
jgi:heterodisulfide reductase subunit A-like polyferredoxin